MTWHVLVIDTSSAAVTAAAATVGTMGGATAVLAERVTINARGHGELLAPAIRECLAEAALPPARLDAIVAGLGPGPFTGLRVGLVTAAVLGELLGVPTYGVCSLDAIGVACADEDDLLVTTDARRKEVYWARYRGGVRIGDADVAPPVEVRVDGASAIAGIGAQLYDFGLPALHVWYPPVGGLLDCAADRIRAGAPSEGLVPLYLRRPDAVAATSSKRVTR